MPKLKQIFHREPVTVGEQQLFLQEWSAKKSIEYSQKMTPDDAKTDLVEVVHMTLVNEDGDSFTYEEVGELPQSTLIDLYKKSVKLNTINTQSIEEQKKSSETTTSISSVTTSQDTSAEQPVNS